MSFLLLVCAGLFLRALWQGQALHRNLEPERVQTATFDPAFIGYDEPRAHELYRQLLERVRARPEVEAAGVANSNIIGDRRKGPLAVAGRGRINLPPHAATPLTPERQYQ
jgi:hypothetical protein